MLPLALGEDIHRAIAASGSLERARRRQCNVIFGGKSLLSLRAGSVLLLG